MAQTKGRLAERAEHLKITEVFYSLQGEALQVGLPTVFVRLTGCPLRCVYCDTTYSFHGGDWRSFDELVAEIQSHGTQHVCVTGGEPLAQKNCPEFLSRLLDEGFSVSLETSGAMDISVTDERVIRVLDLKTPDSAESDKNLWTNLAHLTPQDQIKIVVCSRDDYDWAKQLVQEKALADICTVMFSPSHEQVSPTELAEWILEDRLPVRLQMQLHKLLWGNKPGV
ncbi:MAG: 7-carboxy-7-deazaguanine synthase QueE [Gammaproteobacteria bacterium]|nr:7-carboxy-7-deazaguanine synthase QueE [Gammaproteobacteria bacterium]